MRYYSGAGRTVKDKQAAVDAAEEEEAEIRDGTLIKRILVYPVRSANHRV